MSSANCKPARRQPTPPKRRRRRVVCSRPNCGDPAVGRRLCGFHYEKHRRLLSAEGRFETTFIDAAPSIAHYFALREACIGLPQITRLSGLSRMTVDHLGDPGRQRVSRRTAAAILAIPIPESPLDPNLADGAKVDSVGTVRRLRALSAAGWPRAYVAERLHLDPDALPLGKLYQGQTKVTASRARAVADLYRELEGTPGPDARSRRYAQKLGWVPPLAWDDGMIDDPDAEPDAGDVVVVSFVERYEDARNCGHSTERIAELLGVKPESLERQLFRYGIFQAAS